MTEAGTLAHKLDAAIAVTAEPNDAEVRRKAVQLAADLGLPLLKKFPQRSGCELLLVCRNERLELQDARTPRQGGVYADFARVFGMRPPAANLSRRQPLARAIGRNARTVVDATAGLGQDAFLLSCLGYTVTAIERSPVIAALLRDGLRRAHEGPRLCAVMGGRLRILQADSRFVIGAMNPKPDVIYIDPMFPSKRKKSALANKEIRLIRQLVGDDSDAAELLSVSRRNARQRIVVKRPPYAPPLAPEPTVSHKGKLVRYDVYVTPPERKQNLSGSSV